MFLPLLVHLIVLAILMLGSNIHQSNIIEKLAVQTEPKPLKIFLYYAPKASTKPSIKPVVNEKIKTKAIPKKNTMKMSDGISITRLGNGYCIIERGQALGSPIPASRSSFACGESDFDKSFKEHMKKLSKKLTPSYKSVN